MTSDHPGHPPPPTVGSISSCRRRRPACHCGGSNSPPSSTDASFASNLCHHSAGILAPFFVLDTHARTQRFAARSICTHPRVKRLGRLSYSIQSITQPRLTLPPPPPTPSLLRLANPDLPIYHRRPTQLLPRTVNPLLSTFHPSLLPSNKPIHRLHTHTLYAPRATN